MVTLSSRRERIDQLADLLDGTLVDDDARRDVRRLATLATTVATEIELPRLEAAERDRIRERVMAAVHTDLYEAEATRTGPTRAQRSTRAALATGVASVLIGTSGVAVAAQEALPGDALYGIKQATESVRMAAAGDLTEQGRLDLALATERLEEVQAAVARGGVRDQDLVDTLQRMDARSISGAQTLARVAERSDEPELLDEIARFTERQASGLVDVFNDLPAQVRPHAEDSLATLRAIREELLLARSGDVTTADLAGSLDALLRSAPLPPGPAPTEATTSTGSSSGGEGGTTADPDTAVTPTQPGPRLPLPSGSTGTANGGDRSIVPRLPGPLDDAGKAVDDSVGGLLDGTGKLLEGAVDTLDETVDDVVDGTTGLLDGALGSIGGLLGGTSQG